jgi:hypothetical protein
MNKPLTGLVKVSGAPLIKAVELWASDGGRKNLLFIIV